MHAACLSHWFNDRNRKLRQMVVEGCSLLAGPAKSMSSLWKERKIGVMEAVAILSCSLLPTMQKCSRTIGTRHLSQTHCCQLLVLRCLAMDSGTQSTCSATLPVWCLLPSQSPVNRLLRAVVSWSGLSQVFYMPCTADTCNWMSTVAKFLWLFPLCTQHVQTTFQLSRHAGSMLSSILTRSVVSHWRSGCTLRICVMASQTIWSTWSGPFKHWVFWSILCVWSLQQLISLCSCGQLATSSWPMAFLTCSGTTG